MNDSAVFEARRLRLSRGTVVKRPLSFALSTGQWCVLRGENGSGKTTLLRVLCGLCEPLQGDVYWQGLPISRRRECYHQALIYIGHKLGFRGGLSVSENLRFYRDLGARNGSNSLDEAIDSFGLSGVAKRPYASLSHGQRQRSALCRLMIEEATLWLLDEPTGALDKQGHDIFQKLLRKHLDKGGMAVVATHKSFNNMDLQDAHRLRLKTDV